MAVDHIVVSLAATTKTILFTVPSKVISCHVTVQNRDTVADVAIGDDTLGAVSGANAGVLVPKASGASSPTNFQLWLNPGDVLYGYSSAAMTNSLIILYSYQNITNPNYAPPAA